MRRLLGCIVAPIVLGLLATADAHALDAARAVAALRSLGELAHDASAGAPVAGRQLAGGRRSEEPTCYTRTLDPRTGETTLPRPCRPGEPAGTIRYGR